MSSTSGLLFLRAQTALHPGAGSSVGTIDLPIQRERYTRWPIIQGSSVKGVLREAYRMSLLNPAAGDVPLENRIKNGSRRQWADEQCVLTAIFGKADGESGYAGSVAVTDARILAFPVRSARGVFAWVTCAAVLNRVREDYEMADIRCMLSPMDDVADAVGGMTTEAVQKLCFPPADSDSSAANFILEDVPLTSGARLVKHATEVVALLESTGATGVAQRLVIVSDDVFCHFVMHCTEIATRIALDYDTKRVKGTALFVVEMLPAETIMYSVLLATERQAPMADPVAAIRDSVSSRGVLQLGGEETTGKGWCRAKVVTAQ